MQTEAIPMSRRQELVDAPNVTMDGQRAKISGYRNDYATVRRADGLSAEWSWATVNHIVINRSGAFAS